MMFKSPPKATPERNTTAAVAISFASSPEAGIITSPPFDRTQSSGCTEVREIGSSMTVS